MTTVTHTLTGLVIGKLFYLSTGTTGSFDNYYHYLAFCVIAANLPDINFLWHSNLYWHHKDPTHYPIMSALLLLFLSLIGSLAGFQHEVLIMAVLYAVHLFFDSFGARAGIYLLGPIRMNEFSFLKLLKDESAGWRMEFIHMRKNGLFFIEFLLICFSIWVLVKY